MHKTQSPHQVGSTAWYKAMADKLVDVAFDSKCLRLQLTGKNLFSGRNAKLITDHERKRWKNGEHASGKYEPRITNIPIYFPVVTDQDLIDMMKPWTVSAAGTIKSGTKHTYAAQAAAYRYIMGCDPATDHEKQEKRSRLFMDTIKNPLFDDGGFPIRTTNHLGLFFEPKDKYYIGNTEVSKHEYDIKRGKIFGTMPNSLKAFYERDEPELRRIDPRVVTSQEFDEDYIQLQPISKSGLAQISEENQKTLDLYRDGHKAEETFKKIADGFLLPLTFEKKVYYIRKYDQFVQVKSRNENKLVLGGLSQFISDSKTNITRQEISIRLFQDLNPIEIDENKLHMYTSFISFHPWTTTEGGAWGTRVVTTKWTRELLSEADKLPSAPSGHTFGMRYPH